MLIQSILLGLVAASTAVAAPSSPRTPAAGGDDNGITLEARDLLFKVCRHADFKDCLDYPANLGSCINAPNGWNDAISSVKTTDPFIYCFIYRDSNCSGDRGGPVYDDDRHRNLEDFAWNDVISSWRCSFTYER
ncbi:uncharacterized protein B0I36DRAFT_361442 [Microdochium trichocladiopsis]|uniref:Uncharacterized protein n=1 Tax=Microdochium trichocladiopsis TaxID=1682393 RepID=A0A9P8YAK0_9PEZI|nr:uncharacterized protein B0I36DRAFT_361442 [Microdochium trichocladiopsis]KAH7032662.1 hypothetical protein B0I36DRAFT_361442 [Microdochium trichocladiopsis]